MNRKILLGGVLALGLGTGRGLLAPLLPAPDGVRLMGLTLSGLGEQEEGQPALL